MEAEFIAASEAAKELKFLKACLDEISVALNFKEIPVVIQRPILMCDNTAAIHFIKNKAENIRNRHIDMKYKFVCDLYESGVFSVNYVSVKDNLADMLTKALTKETFLCIRNAYLW